MTKLHSLQCAIFFGFKSIFTILLTLAFFGGGCENPNSEDNEKATQYTVTFIADSYSEDTIINLPETQTINKDDKIIKPIDPTNPNGAQFLGWYENLAIPRAWDFNTDTVTANTTLYAKWEWLFPVITLAGDGTQGDKDGEYSTAQFGSSCYLEVDEDGNIYVADTDNNRIRKIALNGNVSNLAGSGFGDFKDDLASAAQFNAPCGIAIDRDGNVYVADSNNHRIRKITMTTGEVSTLAGSGSPGNRDASAELAQFNYPSDVTVDSDGNVYVADTNNNRIRKITPAGDVSTLAGSIAGFFNGTGNEAQFNEPSGLVVDTLGNVYVADKGNHSIRKITSAGEVSVIHDANINDPASNTEFLYPFGLTVDKNGNVYVADTFNHRIRMIRSDGEIITLAGNEDNRGNTDGPSSIAQFNSPSDVVVDTHGNIYVADKLNYSIRKILADPNS